MAHPSDGPRERQWRRAFVGLLRLAKNTEDTEQVFEIIRALNGDCLVKTRDRMRRGAGGRAILRERPRLTPLLADHAFLERLPEGSLGRAYLRFMQEGELTADGLQEANGNARAHDSFDEQHDEELQYVGDRLIEMHDLWHVLTGYGRDDTGELANLWFSYGQFGQLGMAFIALMGTLDGPSGSGFFAYMRDAYWRGRTAKLLVAEPLEGMLGLPLARAREVLGISPPDVAHPGGIRTGNRRLEGIGRGEPRVSRAA